jgi:hypothetical protein
MSFNDDRSSMASKRMKFASASQIGADDDEIEIIGQT